MTRLNYSGRIRELWKTVVECEGSPYRQILSSLRLIKGEII
jgi:hypothetical protein